VNLFKINIQAVTDEIPPKCAAKLNRDTVIQRAKWDPKSHPPSRCNCHAKFTFDGIPLCRKHIKDFVLEAVLKAAGIEDPYGDNQRGRNK
jgi:hypothetical protein